MYFKFGLLKKKTHLRVLENKVQRTTFGPKKQENSKSPEKMQSEELHHFTVHLDITEVLGSIEKRRRRHGGWMGQMINSYHILILKRKWK
jgi:hypothetical protein